MKLDEKKIDLNLIRKKKYFEIQLIKTKLMKFD